jgi:hypothetical protein
MNSNENPYMMSDPWQRAWRIRCCPPDAALHQERQSSAVTGHVEVCPWCRQALDEEPYAVNFAGGGFSESGQIDPQAGELWTVKNSLAGWGEKARYYSSPIILIVRRLPSGRLDVMQVYDDGAMSGPEDIYLLPEYEGFVEPWNRYTLDPSDLAFAVGAASPQVLEQCLNPSTAPGDNRVEPGSLLWFFRNLEIETGFFFAEQSVARAMAADPTEQREVATSFSDREAFLRISRQDLSRQLSGLKIKTDSPSAPVDSAFDILLHSELAEESLPLAAAAAEPFNTALIFTCHEGDIISCAQKPFHLNPLHRESDILRVSGAFQQEAPIVDDFLCACRIGDVTVLPMENECHLKDGVFWASFRVPDRQVITTKPEIIIRCLKYS